MSVRRLVPWGLPALAVLGAASVLAWGAWGAGGGGEALPPGDEPVTAIATVSPATHLVGDRVLATLELTFDRDRASPERVALTPVFAPYSRTGPVGVERRDMGRVTVLRYTYRLQCVDRPCLAKASVEPVELAQAIVRYAGPFGQTLLSVRWPELRPLSRLAAGEGGSPDLASGSLEPPPVGYAVTPAVLGWLLASLAAAIVLATGVGLGRRLRGAPGPPEEASPATPSLPPIEHALRLLDEAVQGREEDRRAALDTLARALEGDVHAAAAPRARRLAWSRAAPGPAETAELANEIRRSLREDA